MQMENYNIKCKKMYQKYNWKYNEYIQSLDEKEKNTKYVILCYIEAYMDV